MQYVRTPLSLGQDVGQERAGAFQGLYNTQSYPAQNTFGLSANNYGAGGSYGTGGYNPSGGSSNPSGSSSSSSGSLAAPSLNYNPQSGGSITSPNFNYTSSNTKSPANVTMGALPGQVSQTTLDTSAAQNAQFNRAKDLASQNAKSALSGLSSAMAGRGLLGSGTETRGMERTFQAGQQQLGDVARQQAMTAADMAQRQAEAAYQGGIAQRGQDIGVLDQQYQGDISQRGQDISSQQEDAQRALQAALGQYQGGITLRGQDISTQQDEAQRALQAALAQYQGGITTRGQDIQNSQFGANYGLSQQELALKQQQAAMQALQSYRY
jgi:hypothetical protein